MKLRHRRPAEGFTLIELLLVVVIIGILAAIVVPRLVGRSDEARVAAAKGDLKAMNDALGQYEVDNGKYPSTSQGLHALLSKPSGAPEPKNWKGPYLSNLSEIPKDPWGNEYQFACPGSRFPAGFDLYSYGPDGAAGTDDDVWLGK